MLTMNQKNELRGLLVEIELKVRRAQQMLEPQPVQDELDVALNTKPSYDKVVEENGVGYAIEQLMALKTLPDNTRSFLVSLYDGFKKYNSLTPKQHESLSKCWWHNMVKEK